MRFERYINEGDGDFDLNKRIVFSWKGHKVVNTEHGKQRIKQRSDITDFQMLTMFKNAIKKIESKSVKIGEKIVFWSKTLGQAFIAKIDDVKDLILLTFFPRHKKPSGVNDPYQREVVIEGEHLRIVEI